MSNIKLKAFSIKGYKSIKEIEQFEPRPLNILIGPNGAGKSNFISFFKFLSWVLNSNGQLQEHVAYLGGANDILHDGVDATQRIDAAIAIETNKGTNKIFNAGQASDGMLRTIALVSLLAQNPKDLPT